MLKDIAAAFEHGGFWMWAILAVQVVAMGIIAERVAALYIRRKPTQRGHAGQYENDIRKGDLQSVIQNAQRAEAQNPVARAVHAGAQAAFNMGGQPEIQAKMDEVLIEENSTLDRRIGFLAMLGNVATLLGLLGTITGMIKSFAAVSFVNPMEKAALLSQGISEAMNCTAYGLVVAIPSLALYAVFQSRATALAEDLNQGALKAYNWLSYAYESVSPRHQRSAHTK